MNLNELGKFKIEKGEDYNFARKDGLDLSYYTLIRVSGSKPSPCYAVPSHLYKYSEHELGLYLKDHKIYWRKLGKLLGIDVEISDNEVVFVFPATRFTEVAKTIRLVKSRARKTALSQTERENAASRLTAYYKNTEHRKEKQGKNIDEWQ
ncbi:hypothetical protein ACLIKE_03915 [Ferroplasma acidiphilum]|uniref:Uncharacterized protein n=1 Tax=Ferroplasma acidiphilum TaxID=74969 RepID=A0A7K4FML0_9ARCH|nr:hypothetical protein [Ferroplasma acidiphilum]NOL60292.1 hypothetical protein [Ferroplasma acidiphilum]